MPLQKFDVPLQWRSLHRKAADFLFTEGTLQQLSNDNATYALALINGTPFSLALAPGMESTSGCIRCRSAVTVLNESQRTAVRMAMIARGTAAGSNG